MPRPRNPLSKRNRSATFTGAEVAKAVERLAASKRARVVRDKSEFDLGQLSGFIRAPQVPAAAYSWSIQQIVDARDAQMSGRFRMPARLVESMGTDDALFTARAVRLAPVQSLGIDIKAGRGPKADKIADEADALFGVAGVAISSETMRSIRNDLVHHGVAFAAITWRPRADGSRWDPELKAWPIEFVWWNAAAGCYYTQVRHFEAEEDPKPGAWAPAPVGIGQPMEPIIHGDGRWVVFSSSQNQPHRFDAVLLPASMVWARHAFAMRDWAKGSASHGNPKVLGELPADTALTDEEGSLTAEASSFLTMLQAVASQDMPIGIQPSGSKVNYLTNTSGAWEVWVKLAEVAERAAARIYLGTDGILGAQGGAPGVDISELFGVATANVQGDLTAIERGTQTGLIEPWAAINFGDSKQAPVRSYRFPDPDESRIREDFSKRNAAFLAALKAAKDAGYQLTPEYTKELAEKYAVPVPVLAAPAAPDATQDVAPTPPAG